MKVLLILLFSLMVFSSSCTVAEPYVDREEKYDLLYESYLNVKDQRDVAREEVAKLEEALITLNIKYESKKMIYDDLVDDYKTSLRFIDMAEYIIYHAGIEFVYTGSREIEEW